MSWSGSMTINSSKKGIRKLVNHWYLESLTDIQLIQLHMVGSSFSYDYRLGDILISFLFRVVIFIDFPTQSISTLCLLNQSLLQK
jgi:hypothetical protein